MELQEKMYNLSERIKQLKENIQTEEATKQSFILPFFRLSAMTFSIRLNSYLNLQLMLELKNMKKSTMLYCKKVSH